MSGCKIRFFVNGHRLENVKILPLKLGNVAVVAEFEFTIYNISIVS